MSAAEALAGRVPSAPVRIARIGSRDDIEALGRSLGRLRLDARLSCARQVLDVLLRAIVDARLLPGTPLSEAALASVLGVSRTPVREALRELANEQFVRVYPKAGTVVAPLDIDALREGCFIRSALECANILELAPRVQASEVRELRALIRAQRAAIGGDRPDEFFRLDEALHARLFELSGRRRTWERIEQLKRHFDRVRWLLQRDPDHARRTVAEHAAIVTLLGRGDGPAASKAMLAHIDAVNEDLLQLRHRAPMGFFES